VLRSTSTDIRMRTCAEPVPEEWAIRVCSQIVRAVCLLPQDVRSESDVSGVVQHQKALAYSATCSVNWPRRICHTCQVSHLHRTTILHGQACLAPTTLSRLLMVCYDTL
jgi:hypothetical protein